MTINKVLPTPFLHFWELKALPYPACTKIVLALLRQRGNKAEIATLSNMTHDLCDTGVMLYQLSYEALQEAGQVRVPFIAIIYEENDLMCI